MDLARILECLLPVRFIGSKGSATAVSGEIIIENVVSRTHCRGDPTVSSLVVPQEKSSSGDRELIDFAVNFADDLNVPFPFRGRSLRAKVAMAPEILSLSGDETALANSDLGPVWTLSNAGGVKHFRSAFALPRIAPDGNLRDVLNGDRFLEILPVLHWLRKICSNAGFQGPPLRACFIFDDPNLHWKRYGFVDFEEIAARAARENYHVSFATIPLDTWFTHKAAAEILKNNAGRLSLAVHGNDHTREELARDYTEAERAFLLRQAIHRVERLERKAGLRVCRVMVPPHGACSEEMLAELPRCGFESACISHGSLRAHNKSRPWTRMLGYLPSELIQGCSVLPRWGLSGNARNTVLLAAFLHQPIVLRGHHEDLKQGVEILDHLASFINGLGSVLWSNLTDLSRLNLQWRIEGNTCRLKPLSRRVNFQMPKQATRLIIESPGDASWGSWQISGTTGAGLAVRTGECVSLPEAINSEIFIEAAPPQAVLVAAVSDRCVPAAVFRRLLTEGRDRFLS